MDRLFWVGPVGAMMPLPDLVSPVSVPRSSVGKLHSSLYGTSIADTFPAKRSWSWSWSNMLPRQTVLVEALQAGMVDGPLRLVDPRRGNRLPEQVASGGSVLRSSDGFAVSLGTLTYGALTSLPASGTTLGPRMLLRGAQVWLPGGAGSLYPTGSSNDATWRVPVLPGEQLELSIWVTGATDMAVTQTWREYNAAGTITTNIDPTGPQVLTTGQWRRLTTTVTPAAATVALSPRLTVAAPGTLGQVCVTGWQVASIDADTLPDGGAWWQGDCDGDVDLGGGWRTGGGAPFVLVPPGSDGGAGHSYPAFPAGLHNAEFTLREV